MKMAHNKMEPTDNPESGLRLKNQFGNSYEHFENSIRPNTPGAEPAPGCAELVGTRFISETTSGGLPDRRA